MKQSIP